MTDAERRLLLQLARGALTARANGTALPLPEAPEAILRLSGAFVTLHSRGQLRGCIGHVEADEPLGHVVLRCAVAAGFTDPRFPAITVSELDEIDIELSILGPLEPVRSPDEIEVGRHGLVVEMGWRRGLLLPQVAIEWNWDRLAFVAETCRKAGLPADAWQRGATIWRFEAEVFSEIDKSSFQF